MAVRSKPQQALAANAHQIDELIEKGGSVATELDPPRRRTVKVKAKPDLVQLRLPRDLVDRIDGARTKRTVPPSRHAWMLEAIIDKLRTAE